MTLRTSGILPEDRVAHRECCALCHRESAVGFHVPDDVWEAATHRCNRNDILCLACFTQQADMRLVPWDDAIEFYPTSLVTHLFSCGLTQFVEIYGEWLTDKGRGRLAELGEQMVEAAAT